MSVNLFLTGFHKKCNHFSCSDYALRISLGIFTILLLTNKNECMPFSTFMPGLKMSLSWLKGDLKMA